MKSGSKSVAVNGRDYRWPQASLVVICCDGSEPDYMEMAMAEGLMPNLKKMIGKGEFTRGFASFPALPIPTIFPLSPGRRQRFTASAGTISLIP